MSADRFRIGHGFDVHRFSEKFVPDKPLMLGGLKIEEPRSLLAHSDGDVVLHAVCDAVLGAIGEGDIGQHFPDTDEAFANVASCLLLKQVLEHASGKGWLPVNVDITVIAQVPKLAPYREAMRERLADLMGLKAAQVNVKATTTEGLGFIGREEGIACHCVTLLSSAI
jgi:2-C-methyl-D-erythritol 2,4-cyclodiphosphate synthase